MTKVQGPLIMQSPAAAALAEVFAQAASDLWDAAALEDTAQMWEEGRAAASRVMACCHRAAGELAARKDRKPAQAANTQLPPIVETYAYQDTVRPGETGFLPGLPARHDDNA